MNEKRILNTSAIDINCKRCGHSWLYSGSNKWIATCPHCRRILNIRNIVMKKV